MNLKKFYKKNFRKYLLLLGLVISWISFSYGQVGCFALDFKNNTDAREFVQVNAAPICPEDDEAFTVAAWFNVDLTVGSRPIVSIINGFDGADAGTFVIRVNNDDLEVFSYPIDGNPVDLENFPNVITAGQWHHVAAVKIAGVQMITVYLDGVSLGTFAMDFADDGECAANTLLIGRRRLEAPPNMDAFFQGLIDDVAIWNTNLSGANILALATNIAHPPANTILPGSLQAYYDMEDGTGLVLSDQSGNLYNGTMINMEGSGPNSDWIENELVISCPSQLETVLCGESTDFGEPVVLNCPQVQLIYGENIAPQPCPSPFITIITKYWYDPNDIDGPPLCTQVIQVMRIDNDLFECPDNLDDIESPSLSCDDIFQTDINGHPHPNVTGYPTVDGVEIQQNVACDIVLFYTDQVVPLDCDANVKYIRTWTLMQDCPLEGNPNMVSCIQTIKVLDKEGPTVTCPDDRTVSTASNSCVSGLIVLVPVITDDNCSEVISVTTTLDGNIVNGNVVSGLSLGVHTVVVFATDECGNESEECSYTITVEDQINPVAVCDQVTVSISTDPTLIAADVFEEGSSDNCGIVSILARRMNSPHCIGNDETNFGANVPFYCCDVNQTVTVAVQVTDAAGNTNICMVDIPVDDKIDPIIDCPDNITVDCWESTHPDVTGYATATDNCDVVISPPSDFVNLNSCNVGTIIRTWTATDPSGNTDVCTQYIYIQNLTPFNPNTIIWPPNINNAGCTLPSSTGEPQYQDTPCDLVGHTILNEWTAPVANGCIKIWREWVVFDECQPDNGCDAFPANVNWACWTHIQEITLMNTQDPTILTCQQPDDFCSYDDDCEEGIATLTVVADDDCNVLNYYYRIDLDYLTNPGFNTPWLPDPDHDGSITDVFDLGTHLIKWKVEDGCGNFSVCEYPFVIKDCKTPNMNLIEELTTNIMQTGMVEVCATDFDNPNSPTNDNCGIQQWLIVFPSSGGGNTPPNGFQSCYIFDCDDVDLPQPLTVEIWVQDINGNWESLEVKLILQDNNNPSVCNTPPTFNVSGGIENEEGGEVANVDIEVEGDNMQDLATTGNDGLFGFNLPSNSNYTITPELDNNILNGVSTYDLVLISKHILQFELLSSPYKIIAADVNNSGSVSTLDLVDLRKVILFIDDEFTNNTSWRFVDASFVFPDPTDPFATSFPEVFTINGLSEDEIADFVGIKVGDVNCSASTNDLISSEDRNADGDLVFALKDQSLKAGETYRLDFEAQDFEKVEGFQFTISFDQNAIDFNEVSNGDLSNLSNANFGLHKVNEGIITASWNANREAQSLDNGKTLFSFSFTALKDGQLSDLISLNSRFTKAEAYNQNGLLNLSLQFVDENGTIAAGQFELYQNQPNPFKNETVIGFNLPESGKAVFKVFDISGRLIKMIEGDYYAGYNEISISRSELQGSGVLYYQLESADHIASKKMVLMD